MDNSDDHVRLVRKAQLGDKESLDRLTELAEERLRVDVYRLTLQDDLAQEVVQETLFEMLRVLNNLKEANRFWPWLYRIAINKVRLHYRTEKRRRTVTATAAAEKRAHESSEHVMAGAISQELKEIVLGAMRRLKPRYRTVLTMRCYREMEYSQIAESMGCSEFAAKMLFYRAKKSLRKQLGRFGFGKGLLLPALVLFGKMTARSEAAHVTVSGAAMKVGVVAGVVGFATSTTGLVSVATVGLLAVGAATVGPQMGDAGAGSIRGATSSAQVAAQMGSLSAGAEEHWCYYPRSVNGPVMMRVVRWDAKEKGSYCKWLQNEQASYYFDERKGTVSINNHRMWRDDLSVWRLPTDPPELSEFLSRVEWRIDDMRYIRGDGAGLLVISRRDEDTYRPRVTHHFNVLDEQYFLYDWSARTRRLDNRDAMHKRGWTYYRISGEIDGKNVSGTGRLPFVEAAHARFGPWLELKVGQRLRIGDNGSEARVYDGERPVASYAGGSFFAGLGRPWMGLHTIDTVRRDAAWKQLWFETTVNRKEGSAEVVITRGETKLTYMIDMKKDVVDRIGFAAEDGREGELEFSYLDELDEGTAGEFVAPRWRSSNKRQSGGPGMLWLLNLADGKW